MLKISEAANLAIHALAMIGRQPPGEYAATATIAARLQCSPSHLSKVLNTLTRKGLLESSRGATGGFRLTAEHAEVTALEVLEIVDGPVPVGGCLLGQPMCAQGGCVFQDLSAELRERFVTRLGEVRLVDLAIRK